MANDFYSIGYTALGQGINLGNSFFESQFKINGITDEQQRLLLADQYGIYQDKVNNLFIRDAQVQLDSSTNPQQTLNGFDRFLSAYANIAISTAYNTIVHDIEALNTILGRKYSLGDISYPKDPVKVKWILRETAQHSEQCEFLARGEHGSGIWDAKTLADNQLFPASPRLDCGGNCRCTLEPLVPTTEAKGFIDKLIEVGVQRDTLELQPNMSVKAFKALFNERNYAIPENILNSLADEDFFRRSEFYKNLPNLSYNKAGALNGGILIKGVVNDNPFPTGETALILKGGKTFPGAITIIVPLVEGQTLDDLTVAQLYNIKRTFAHELGHIIASDNQGRIVSAVLNSADATELMFTAEKQREAALDQLEIDFQKTVANFSGADKTDPRIQATTKIISEFMKDPDNFLDRLKDAFKAKKSFAGMDPRQVYTLFENLINQVSPGSFLISAYQTMNTEEFFAEWFSLLFTDPSKAALYNPSLNKMIFNRLPQLFETAVSRRGTSLLPSAASITLRSDIPLGAGFEPIAPNLTYKFAYDRFNTEAKSLSKTLLNKQLKEVLDSSPNLLRNEFFKDLDVNFVSRISMGTRAGSRNILGYFDKSEFVINADIWKTLSVQQRTSTVADILSDHMWASSSVIRTQVVKQYKGYVLKALTEVRNKVSGAVLDNEAVVVIMRTISGPPSNLSFWMRNFEAFAPFLKSIPDLPILDISSLASPQAFLKSWFQMYAVHPEVAVYYNSNLVGTIKDYLNISQVK